MNSPESAITRLVRSIKASERTRGVEVIFGARNLPLEEKPPRILIIPQSANYEYPENNGNWVDVPLQFDVRVWGETFDNAVDLRGRFLQACFDFQFATNLLRLTFEGEEWDPEPDTARQGWEVSISVTVRDTVQKVPLAADAGEATVDAEQFAPAIDSFGPTLSRPLP